MMRSVFARLKENACPPDEKPKSEPEPPAAAASADEPAQEPGGPDASLGMMRSVRARLKAKPAQPDEPAPEPPADAAADEPARGGAEDAQSLGMLRSMFARLKMKDGRTPHEAEAARPKLLPSFDMAAVATLLREGRAKRVIVAVAPGISVSAGIPDFRTPGTGLYDNLQKYQLPHPQAIFEIDYFREHPFYQVRRSTSSRRARARARCGPARGMYRPTPTHASSSGSCTRRARCCAASRRTSTRSSRARACRARWSSPRTATLNARRASRRACPSRSPSAATRSPRASPAGARSPSATAAWSSADIVFFGENLPRRFFVRAAEDFPQADLLLVIVQPFAGFAVQPFAAGLTDQVREDCPRVLINREPAGMAHPEVPAEVAKALGMGDGFRFEDAETNYRDVGLLGDCDDQCRQLAAAAGWGAELDAIVAEVRRDRGEFSAARGPARA